MAAADPVPDVAPRADAGEPVAARRYGPQAWLLEVPDTPAHAAARRTRHLAHHLATHPPQGLREAVPAFDRILLDFQGPADATRFGEEWPAFRHRIPDEAGPPGVDAPRAGRRTVEVAVHFGGADLGRVARHAGCPEPEVVEAFCAARYEVQCLGFSPGFPYLTGLPARLQVPRQDTPRTRVPAGSVAIGGEHAGLYPLATPGGWNLLGQTAHILFDPDGTSLTSIFRLHPGDPVRFFPTDHPPNPPQGPPPGRPRGEEAPGRPVLRVRGIGGGLRVQDLGRPGHRRFGVPAGGAMDPAAALAANRVLDNPDHAPVLELCGLGQVLEALEDLWIGVAGPRLSGARTATTLRLRAGECLRVPGVPGLGVWSYVAVPGGLLAPCFLGSHGSLAHLGPSSGFRAGAHLAAAPATAGPWPAAIAGRFLPAGDGGERPVRIWPGPQWELFPEPIRARFLATPWTVSSQSDRVGYRLEGPALWTPGITRKSEPVLPGSIQVPPAGLPIVTMPDGPTLGGYPKLGLVEPEDLPRVAQTAPGRSLRFVLRGA